MAEEEQIKKQPENIFVECVKDKESQLVIDIKEYLTRGPIAGLQILLDKEGHVKDEGLRREIQVEIDKLRLVGQNLRKPVPPPGPMGTAGQRF